VLKVGLQVGGYPEVHKSFHNWFLVDLHTLYLGTIRTQIFLYWISFYV